MTKEESKKLVKELHDKYYKKKGSAKKKTGTEKSRNDLMLEAKAKGIKNFRVLNKAELSRVLEPKVTEEEIAGIVKGAVDRWKSGWSKNKVTDNKE